MTVLKFLALVAYEYCLRHLRQLFIPTSMHIAEVILFQQAEDP